MQRELLGLLLCAWPAMAGWAKIYSVEIDRTQCGASSQSYFPVLFHASDPSLRDTAHGGSVTSSNGYDIVVATDTSIRTYQPWEIEAWDNVNGVVWGWTQVAVLNGRAAGSNTTFAVAWGNSSIAAQQNTGGNAPWNVWSNHFSGVWHLGNGMTLGLSDATSNLLALANTGGVGAAAGEIGGGANFSGTDYLSHADAAALHLASFTISAWVQPADFGDYRVIVNKGTNTVRNYNLYLNKDTGQVTVAFTQGAGAFKYVVSSGAVPVGSWSHIAGTYDGATLSVYINGAPDSSAAFSGSPDTSTDALYIGQVGNGANYFSGNADEPHISDVARNGDWITAEYNNQNAPGDVGAPGFLIWTAAAARTAGMPVVFD